MTKGELMNDFTKKHIDSKIKLFKEMIKLCENKVWSINLLKKAESNCNLNPGYIYIIFPDGESQILQEFESWQDDVMLKKLETIVRPKQIRQRIALALENRIMHIIPKQSAINISSVFLLPKNILSCNKANYQTCDIIWKYAGDQSTDFNYYTKRALLLSVYLSSKAFYYADLSENHKDTKIFIQESLDNIINIAKIKNQFKLPKVEDIPILRLFS